MREGEGHRWQVPVPAEAAERAFAALDAAIERLGDEPGVPDLALDVALPRAAPDVKAAGRAHPALLTVTLTGGAVSEERCRAVCEALFAALVAALPVQALPDSCPPPEPLPARDWVRLSQAGLPAQLVGRFRLLGEGQEPAPWPGRDTLRIAASTAFGTGHHPTTRGVLVILDALARRLTAKRKAPAPMLDCGCGSGILALAMARLWKRGVWAGDIDPAVIPVVQGHAARNGVGWAAAARRAAGPKTAVVIAAGLDHPTLRRAGPFRLIAANILAGPLMRLAPVFSRELRDDGWLLLSGILAREADAVVRRYRRFGLVPIMRWQEEGWTALALIRPRAQAHRRLPVPATLRRRAVDPDAPTA